MNRVKIPIIFVWKKAYKRYILGLPFAFVLFLEMGLLSLKQVLDIPTYTFYLPLLLVLLIPLFISFIRDYLSFIKFNIYFKVAVLIITNLMISYYYIYIAIYHEGTIRVLILSFIGLFYGTFLWDFFMGLSSVSELCSEHEKSLRCFIKENRNNFSIYIDGSFSADGADSNLLPFKENKRSVFLKVALYFSLPLLFLGKSGAYFFGVWLSNTYNIHVFLLSIIFWLGSLAFLMARSSILNAIALLKLKYPTQEEIEAYTKEKQA